MYSQRRLSMMGRAIVLNSLITSKIWHVLRVFTLSSAVLNKIRSISYKFICQSIFPRPSWDTLCLPRVQGGFGIIDIHAQSISLQLRLIRTLWSPSYLYQTFTTPIIKHLIHKYTGTINYSIPCSGSRLTNYTKRQF